MKATYPKISVITPSYNQGHFLEETILSVLNQQYPNLEYIIMDGGSTDNSVEIIKRYASQVTYWISEKDNGQSDAIGRGFDKATGDIFCWLNSDDVFMPGTLHTVARMFARFPRAGFIYGNRHKIDPQSRVLETIYYYAYVSGQFKFRNPVAQEAAFWTAEAYRRAGGMNVEYRFCMDYDLWCRLARVTQVVHVPYVWGGFRQHGDSKTHTIRHIAKQEKDLIRKKYYGAIPGRVETLAFNFVLGAWRAAYWLLGINKVRRFLYA
jgi:glycosyltransferase involved in cell wall biosynthesis